MKRILYLSIAVLMLLGVMVGCSNQAASSDTQATNKPEATVEDVSADEIQDTQETAETEESPWASIDLLTTEEINFYVVGTLGNDWERIVSQANEMMSEKINTTVNFVHVPWSDFQTKYALFLAGSEDIDLIYGASWCSYLDHVKAGAFKPLSEEFIQTYMPLTWENQAPSSWKEATYEGQIYCVPLNKSYIGSSGVLTRKDLLDKYSLTADDITDWDSLSDYLMIIAQNETDGGLFAINPQGSYPLDCNFLVMKNHYFDVNAGSATWMMWDYTQGDFNVDDMVWYADNDDFLNYALEMAEYNEAGVFPASVIANQTFYNDNFLEGKSGVFIGDPGNANNYAPQLEEKGWELVYLDCLFDDQSVTRRGNYMGYGACFPVGSDMTERAAVALDCMKNDSDVNMLLVGGEEGMHYILSDDGKTYEPGPNAVDYSWNAWCYLLANDWHPALKLDDKFQVYQERYEAAEVPSETFPLNGFSYDSSQYQSEIAVISSIFNEYRFSFCFGIYRDETEAKYNQFISEVKVAGLDEVVADFKAQLAAFLAE